MSAVFCFDLFLFVPPPRESVLSATASKWLIELENDHVNYGRDATGK